MSIDVPCFQCPRQQCHCSGISQAYFYGFWKRKHIVLFDTLIEKATIPEIVAVLGHELGETFHSTSWCSAHQQ